MYVVYTYIYMCNVYACVHTCPVYVYTLIAHLICFDAGFITDILIPVMDVYDDDPIRKDAVQNQNLIVIQQNRPSIRSMYSFLAQAWPFWSTPALGIARICLSSKAVLTCQPPNQSRRMLLTRSGRSLTPSPPVTCGLGSSSEIIQRKSLPILGKYLTCVCRTTTWPLMPSKSTSSGDASAS